tara:strand:+ start:157 stop:369 length:213 start_codon:yes stop_codon:yes gene_type:complete
MSSDDPKLEKELIIRIEEEPKEDEIEDEDILSIIKKEKEFEYDIFEENFENYVLNIFRKKLMSILKRKSK